MRPKTSTAAARLLLDLTEDRADALGQQIYQVGSCQSTHPGISVIEQCGERRPARADCIQGFDNSVHATHNLGLAVRRVPKFVMKGIRKSGPKFKAADKACGAFVVRNRIVTIEKRRDGRQSISLEAIELLRYLESAKQRLALGHTILGIEHRGKTVPPRVQFLS